MGKRKHYPTIDELLQRPFCYYCERDFDDLKILISHQKAKHFKCERCGHRLNTAGGLSVHMNQVHKETLLVVHNALPNRQALDVEIFGMEGIPDDTLQAHNQRVMQQYYEAAAERRAKSGNPMPGEPVKRKKIKIETQEELLSRFKDWVAKKKAGLLDEPMGGVDVQSPIPSGNAPASIVSNSRARLTRSDRVTQPFGQQPQSFGQQTQPVNQPPFPFPPASNSPFQAPPFQAPFPGAPNAPFQSGPGGLPPRPGFSPPAGLPAFPGAPAGQQSATSLAVDDLIASVTGAQPAKPEKKKKDSNSKMIWSDNEVSPEEKLARLPRYAVAPA